LAGLCAGAPLAAAEDGGQAAVWSRLAFGARAAALGQAVSAIEGDVNSAQQNPALLATLSDIALAAQGSLLPDGRSLEYLGLGRPVDKDGGWGWGIHGAWFGDTIPYERRAGNTATPDGTFTGSDSLVQGGLGGFVWQCKVAVGADFRLLYESLDSANGNGVAFDAGAYCRALPWLDLSVVLQDLYGNLGWSTGRSETLPVRSRVAARLRSPDGVFALSLEGVMEGDQGAHALAGLEWWVLVDHLAFRFGYQDGQASLGLGAQGRFFGVRCGLDYSVGSEAGAGDQLQQRLSLNLGFDL
jgi:hypothetical protein